MRFTAGLCTAWFAGVVGTGLTVAGVTVSPRVQAAAPEEITVTARKREEDLQSVPIAITAFTAEDLQVRDIVDLESLADQTPGLSFASTGAVTNRRAIIRGMSQQTRVGDETNVATFIDGIYTPGFSGAEFFGSDGLERIEVLKGPQSALYGRNSFAGAINYVTAKPGFEYEYGGRLTVGEGDRHGATAFVSGPIFNERVATRLDVGYNRSGGSFKNELDGEYLGSADTTYVRLGTLWDGNDRLSFNLSLSWQKDDDTTGVPVTIVADDDPKRVGYRLSVSPFETAAGLFTGGRVGRLYSGEITDTSDDYFIDPRSIAGDRDIYRGGFTVEYDFGDVRLVSVTGYQRREVETLNDFNTCRPDIRGQICNLVSPTAVGTFFGGPLAGGFQIGGVLTGGVEDRTEYSQDLRLQSADDGPLQWSAGVYLSSEKFRDETQRLSDIDLTNVDGTIIYAVADPNPLIDSSTRFKNDFYSAYASLSYDFSDSWNVVAEGRYTREEKSANQQQNNFPTNVPPTGFQDRDYDFITPRFIANYTPNDDLLVYVSAARGVKSGGFNAGSVSRPTFDEESNWTYELGSKYSFAEGKARLNGAVFFVDWDDQQVTATDPDNNRLPIAINVAKTEITGVELEAFFDATEWLTLNFGATYLDAEYKDGFSTSIELLTDCDSLPIPCDREEPPGSGTFVTSGSLAGQQVIGAPESSFNGGAQVDLPIFGGRWGFRGRVDYSWNDKVYIDDANSGYLGERQTVNLRLGIQDENWVLDGYCNNLTDDDTPLFAAPPRDILGVPHYAVINRDDRTCGVQIGYRN
jgi:iron complex outermembrane receptor protein